MSEMENGGELTIPISVTRKGMRDVTEAEKHSKKSVLYINDKGQAHMVPEDMAKGLVKKKVGYIMDKSHKRYMEFFQMAHGYSEKIGTQLFLQKGGKAVAITDAGRFDVKTLMEKEAIEASRAHKAAKDRE